MAGKLVVLFIATVMCFSEAFEIPYSTPEKCTKSQFFQFSSLSCKSCGPGQQQSEDKLSCVCQIGYVKQYGENSCKKCSSSGSENTTSSLDGLFCIKCPESVGYDSKTRTCSSCLGGSFPVDRARNGSRFETRSCVGCIGAVDLSAFGGACKRCHESFRVNGSDSCLCPSGYSVNGGMCLKDSGLISNVLTDGLYSVKYGDKSVNSYFFLNNLRAVQSVCKQNSNLTACQVLGNLCVLLDYNLDLADGRGSKTDACKEYLKIVDEKTRLETVHKIDDWAPTLPWLYYRESVKDALEVLESRDVTTKYAANQELTFVLAVYTLNGTFVGLKNGTEMIQMCKDRPSKLSAAARFATNYRSLCSVTVQELMNMPMYFYDMFLITNEGKLFPIPVLDEDFKKGKEFVNRQTAKKNWQLTRRFLLVDNLVGKNRENQALQQLRYAKDIELVMSLRSSDGEIYPPLLRVRYDFVDVTDKDMDYAKTTKYVSFSVTYEMDTDKIREDTLIAFGCLFGLSAMLAILKVAGWRRRHGSEAIDCSSLLKFTLYLIGSLSTMVFWIIFGLSVQWLIFFKKQNVVYRLLPTKSQEQLFVDFLIVAFVFKFFDLVHVFWAQISIDIFFIDWEKPRGRITQPGQGGDGAAVDAPISIWRTFFIANEWNELQTTRKINIELQLFVVLFFLKVLGFEYLATTDPESRFSVDYSTQYVGEFSRILRFAVMAMVYLLVELVQWFFFAFIYERFVGDSFCDFIDLCSMSNVSIFIMANDLYGYYIHGRSVHGRADTDMRDMNEQLKREEDDLCGKRGLEPNSERQTFEVAIPRRFRQQYDLTIEPLRQRDAQVQRRNMPNAAAGGGANTRLPVAVEKSIQAYASINRFLSAFIDHSLRDLDYLVKDKLLMERILDMEMADPPVDKAVFYNDDSRSFNSVLFYGNEWTLLLFDVLFFAIVDLLATDYVLAAFLTYLMDRLVAMLRNSFGRRNLARKTLVDERFLI